MQKESKKYLVMGIAVTLLTLIGVTYAYWRANIQGEGSQVTLTLKELKVIFTDTQEIVDNEVIPGWSTSKTFTVENQGNIAFKYDIYIKDLINTLVTEDFLQYKITSSNGYNMEEYATIGKSSEASDFDLGINIEIGGGETQEYTIEFRYVNSPTVDQSEDMGKTVSGKLMIRENMEITLYDKILLDHKEVKTRTSFSEPICGESINNECDTTGIIYKESIYKENGNDVYYFAGNPLDNWLKFADKWWRIIRTNEDGSIRLLYVGETPDTTSAYINLDGKTTFTYSKDTNTMNNTMYVGWMYGSSGNLNNNRQNTNQGVVKNVLDDWYDKNINNDIYNTLVSEDTIFCNDRSGESYTSGNMYYAAQKRLELNKRPSYKCGQSANSLELYSDASDLDKFNKSGANGGNGQLTYPVGLITLDELAFAGGSFTKSAPNTYYYRNSKINGCTGQSEDPCSVTGTKYWWTLTPYGLIGSAHVGVVWGSVQSGKLFEGGVHDGDNVVIRPVLSLKSNVKATGKGTIEDPYIPSL